MTIFATELLRWKLMLLEYVTIISIVCYSVAMKCTPRNLYSKYKQYSSRQVFLQCVQYSLQLITSQSSPDL